MLTATQQQGYLLGGLGITGFIAALLPMIAQGNSGVTILYLSGYTDVSWMVAVPLLLFVLAVAAVLGGGLLISGRSQWSQGYFLLLGSLGLLVTFIAVSETVEHMLAFRNACSALQMSAADNTAPMRLGTGGFLTVACYISMTVSGVFSRHDR